MRLVDPEEVTGSVQHHASRVGDARDEVVGRELPEEVVVAGDDERLRADGGEQRPKVELRRGLAVEVGERIEVRRLTRKDLAEHGEPVRASEVQAELHERELHDLRRLEVGRGQPLGARRTRLLDRRVAVPVPDGLPGSVIFGREPRARGGEDEPPHTLGMSRCVFHGDETAVGMAAQTDLLDAELGAELLEVGHVLARGVRVREGAATGATWVDDDALEQADEPAEVGQRRAGEARATGVADQQGTLALAAIGELHRRPSTTRGLRARSGVTRTSSYPGEVRAAATSRAWHSWVSRTRNVVRARRASRSCRPTPTRAERGSQSRIPGCSVSHSSGVTYG